MKEYGFTITNTGRDLLTKILTGSQLTITKVMVGNGKLSGQDPAALTDLVSPKHPATATVPKVTDGTVTFTIQYQNQETGMVTINEYGVFAQDPDAGEILLYYATLGDYPQYVMPGQGDIRRFPVSIALSANDVEVNLAFDSSAFISAKDLDTKVSKTGDTMTGRLWFEDAQSDTQLLIATDNGNSRIVANKKSSSSSDKLLIGCKQMEFVNQAPIKNLSTPTSDFDAANKKYVDDNAGGKRTCRFVVGTSTAGWTKKDCDYLCDGTDDQVEIQAAINALPSTGGEVVVLDGIYHITASINVNKKNVTLRGNGNATVLKRMWSGSNNNGVIQVSNSYCHIENFYINGNKENYNGGNNFGIYLSGNNTNTTITGNICNGNNNSGIYLGSDSTNNTVTGNTCNNNSYGINLYNTNTNTTITENICNNNSYGIYLYNNNAHNTITGNICNGNNSYGIHLYSNNTNTVTGNTCNNNNSGIYLTRTDASTITGNICNGNNNSGIHLYSNNTNTVTGNTCNNNNSGIHLYSNSTKNTITGNTCLRGTGLSSDYTSTQYTIRLEGANNNYNLIANNNIMGKNYVSGGGTGNTFVNNKYN